LALRLEGAGIDPASVTDVVLFAGLGMSRTLALKRACDRPGQGRGRARTREVLPMSPV
jgi:hypothetical protein